MRWLPAWLLVAALPASLPLGAEDRKLTSEERIELIRGLTAEYATAKAFLPRSKKPLALESKGSFDKARWGEIGKENGPAARAGDVVQITKTTIEDKRILLEINGGFRGGRKWYQRIQVTTGASNTPISSGSNSAAPGGTDLALVFPGRVPPLKAIEIKKMLAPVLDFNMRSAAEQYVETLPPATQKAVKEKKAVEGMDKDQVILALGRPERKIRETVDGTELEDWIYGKPPGRIIFVTFEGDKVVRVKEAYAGLGGEVAPRLPAPR
jgi:hypothetical protein